MERLKLYGKFLLLSALVLYFAIFTWAIHEDSKVDATRATNFQNCLAEKIRPELCHCIVSRSSNCWTKP